MTSTSRAKRGRVGSSGRKTNGAGDRSVTPSKALQSVRYMLARLELREVELPKVIGVISAVPAEGVTFVTNALGEILASERGLKTCVVEISPVALDGEQRTNGTAPSVHTAQATDEPGLSHLSLEAHPDGDVRAQILPTIGSQFSTLSESFDHVLVDLPSAAESSDGLLLATWCDAVIIVIRQGSTTESQVEDLVADLGEAPVLGIVLNRLQLSVPRALLRRISSW